MSVDLPACGRIVDGCHRLAIRVYYEDTDAGGIVYHANYLRFFERARSEFLRCLEIDHAAAWRDAEGAATAMGFAVRSVTLDYVSPALLDDALVIDSRVTALGAAWVDVEQRALRGEDCNSSTAASASESTAASRAPGTRASMQAIRAPLIPTARVACPRRGARPSRRFVKRPSH